MNRILTRLVLHTPRKGLAFAWVLVCILFAPPPHAQEQFFTQSGGRGLQNAKTNARLSKMETDVGTLQTEMAKVKPHAFAELGECPDEGEKLRWSGTNWICEKETDPTVQGWAKKALPTCTGGTVLSALGGEFICAQSTAVTTESDPTVQSWAKNPLPSCGSGQTISANGGALVCTADERGLTAESDPNVLGFARLGTGTVPACGTDQVLTMTNGVLSCKLDATGITEEVDPRVQSFARTDIGGYSLTACASGEVLHSIMLGDKVILECTSASGALSGALLLNDLADVQTTGQTSGTVLMYDSGMWRAKTEADPTVPAWAKSSLSSCSSGQVLSYNGTSLSCVDDVGGSANPLTLAGLSDVSVASATSGVFLKYNGSHWVAGTIEQFAQTTLPTCSSGQVLTGDGTNLSCVADAGGSGSPLNLVELGDVRTDVNTVLSPNTNEFLRWNGSKWVPVKDKLSGTLTDGKWCRYVNSSGTVECDVTPGTMALQDADNVSITGGAITVGGLTVNGTVTATLFSGAFSGDGSGLTGISALGDRIVSGTSSVITHQAAQSISFSTAGTERMAITSAGQVGIGSDSPAADLDVSGTIKMSGTGGETCGPSTRGTMRYVDDGAGSYRIQFCRP